MEKYSKEFEDLVQLAAEKSEEFYKSNSKETSPNPYYIGKGNPNAKILVIGKELAIDPFDTETKHIFKQESVENPLQWKNIIESGQLLDFNPLFPYDNKYKKSGGSTWNQYQRLCNLISAEMHVNENNHFFHNFFITELNTIPSKNSPGISNIEIGPRLDFLKNNKFYQNFDVIIVAAGGYLHVHQIEDIFDVQEVDRSQSMRGNKFITFKGSNTNKLVISTRQLSTSVSAELMNKIANQINSWVQPE
ncbi:hypothetical protein [Lunatibacter salilacus]|uniref:hypothetical protein n=1 Tax=Lunatibacter salilacus TaxID=2483804 RepID=UPI00131B8FAC|nr:hypothetical protein [Lunatibacter salilacus]